MVTAVVSNSKQEQQEGAVVSLAYIQWLSGHTFESQGEEFYLEAV